MIGKYNLCHARKFQWSGTLMRRANPTDQIHEASDPKPPFLPGKQLPGGGDGFVWQIRNFVCNRFMAMAL